MRRAVAILVLLAAGGCASSDSEIATDSTPAVEVTASGSSEPEVTRHVAYSTASSKQLDIHRPGGPGAVPVIVVVHGVAQARGNLSAMAEALADEGALVFNVDATMSEPFDSAIGEIACAVRFASAAAADHGGDPGRITLVGNSAGATTGMIVALAGDGVARDCVAEGPAALDAVVGYEGPYDWATTVYGPVDLPAYETTDPELWAAADPYASVGGNPDLVVRLVHGDDTNAAWYEVPRAVSVEFHEALDEAGYDVEITLVDGASHTAITSSGNDAFEATVAQALEVARG